VVHKSTKKIICIDISNGKKHDFKLLKFSNVHFLKSTEVLTDTGYLGLKKIHINTSMPKKKSKKSPLTKEDKKRNKELSSQRVLNEHIIGMIKRFKIVADKYRNRRKRFGLRFSLISGICNFELEIK
jgi:DDE superfamily endonuclease